jgi:hypothetical protein
MSPEDEPLYPIVLFGKPVPYLSFRIILVCLFLILSVLIFLGFKVVSTNYNNTNYNNSIL